MLCKTRFSSNVLFICLELSRQDSVYQSVQGLSCLSSLQGSESQENSETNNNINCEMEDGLVPSPGSSSESPKEV